MKLAYAGDLVLQNIKHDPEFLFGDVKAKMSENACRLLINLESPFVRNGELPIKNKIVLQACVSSVKYIDFLSPYLVNLANNHINDFGNSGVVLTKELLKKRKQTYWGVGYKSESNSNVHVDIGNRIINVAYVTRSSDFTGSQLFAKENLIGGFPPNFSQLKILKESFSDYVIIVNIHWGVEDIRYPEPEKRVLAYKLIDSGADLIIGHHPHIIQPFEIYKGKFIFYSIGNFFFPDIEYVVRNKLIHKKALKHQLHGIIPVVEIVDKKIQKIEIWDIKNVQGKLSVGEAYHLKSIDCSIQTYQFWFKGYELLLLGKRIINFIGIALKRPTIAYCKIKERIS